MLPRTILIQALFLTSSSLAALAASPEEAATIKARLQAYVGTEPGVVEVVPQGNGYAITFDAAPYIAKAASADFKASADPLTMTAEPKGNGQWNVSGKGPWGFQFSAPGKADVTLHIAEQEWSGVFDEALGGFSSSEVKLGGFTYDAKVADPAASGPISSKYTVQSLTISTTATSDGKGGADGTTKGSASGVNLETASDVPGLPPALSSYKVTADTLAYDAETKGLRMRALLDLLAWFVAHPGKDLMIQDQAQLKEKLADALPVFTSITSKSSYGPVNFTSTAGTIALSKLSGDVNMNGAVKDGFLQERFALEGIAPPPGLVPPWTQDLIPTSLVVDFSLAGFDLDTPARAALAQLDLSKDPPLPPATEQTLISALVPTNALTVTFGASDITSPTYKLSYDGALNVNLAGLPTGKFNVKVAGMDAIIAKVQAAAATDPMAQQAMSGLIAARGLGKAEADGALSYAIDIQPMAQIYVNGVNVSAMAGAP